jgi:hypothetical protein
MSEKKTKKLDPRVERLLQLIIEARNTKNRPVAAQTRPYSNRHGQW